MDWILFKGVTAFVASKSTSLRILIIMTGFICI